MTSASRNLFCRVGCTSESGTPSVPRHDTFRIFAAQAASFARVSGVPRVPISPPVKSKMPVLYPSWAIFNSVPPQVSSTSSGCAAMASKSSFIVIFSGYRKKCSINQTAPTPFKALFQPIKRTNVLRNWPAGTMEVDGLLSYLNSRTAPARSVCTGKNSSSAGVLFELPGTGKESEGFEDGRIRLHRIAAGCRSPGHQAVERKQCVSELLSALSYALDLTEGRPMGHSVRSCMIGM